MREPWPEGWASLGPVVAPDAVDALVDYADAVVDTAVRRANYRSRAQATKLVQKWPLPYGPTCPFATLLQRPDVWRALAARVDGPARLIAFNLVIKPPRHSLSVTWHRDGDVWASAELRGVTLWLPLDDIDADSGGVRYMPGTHLGGTTPDLDATEVLIPTPQAGEALIHDAALWHMTGANHTDRWRRALVVALAPADSPPRRESAWNEKKYPVIG